MFSEIRAIYYVFVSDSYERRHNAADFAHYVFHLYVYKCTSNNTFISNILICTWIINAQFYSFFIFCYFFKKTTFKTQKTAMFFLQYESKNGTSEKTRWLQSPLRRMSRWSFGVYVYFFGQSFYSYRQRLFFYEEGDNFFFGRSVSQNTHCT